MSSNLWKRGREAAFLTSTALLMAACGSTSTSTSTAPASSHAVVADPPMDTAQRSPFLIGAWQQPISSAQHPNGTNFGFWKGLGINTLVEIPQTSDLNLTTAAQWDAAACAAGLAEMRRPINDDPMTDTSGRTSACMVAWNLPDEPDLEAVPGVSMSPERVAALMKRDKQANPTRPVYLSLVGNRVMTPVRIPQERPYASVLGASDWLSVDDYPVDAGRANPIHIIARELDGLAQIGPATAKRMAFIETGHIGNQRTPVTPAQMRAEIWNAIIHGARGIIYFSDTAPAQGLGAPSTYDNTSPGIQTMMSAQNALLTSLAPALVTTTNPASFGATVSATGGAVPEVGWRSTPDGKKYVIVVNTAASPGTVTIGLRGAASATVVSENRSLRVGSGGSATDTFEPYGVHIYQVR